MGEKIKPVVSNLCIIQCVATLFGMTYSSTTPMVRDLDRSPVIMVLSCPETALSDFNASHFNNRLLINPGESEGDLAAAAAVFLSLKCVRRTELFLTDSGKTALKLKNSEVQASTGPQASMEDNDTTGTGEKAQVTVISFATSKLATFYQSSNFFRISHDNSSRENSISVIDQAFRWREMSKDLFWIRTNATVNGLTSTSSSMFDSKQAVLGLKSCVRLSTEVENFSGRWRRNFQQDNPTIDNPQLSVFGLYGYYIGGALVMAGDAVEAASFGYQKSNSSQSLNLMGRRGQIYRNESSNTALEGFSRKSGIVCGQLQSPTFEIVNTESKGRGDKGLWKPKNELQKIPNSMGNASNSTSWDDLGSTVWPGDSAPFPRGWCNRRKVRVGVPVKYEFSKFVTVKRKDVTGYGINKFMANLEEMPSANVSEFTSFGKPIKEMAATYNGTYNAIMFRFYKMNSDAIIGDTTIINCTLPFRKSDPTEDDCCSLGVNHWVVYIYFFVFIGSVVWILVKLVNDDFGSQTRQARTSL